MQDFKKLLLTKGEMCNIDKTIPSKLQKCIYPLNFFKNPQLTSKLTNFLKRFLKSQRNREIKEGRKLSSKTNV